MLVNLTKENILHFLIAILALVEVALQKKHLTASFVEHLKEKRENTICVYFHFYNSTFSREKWFMLLFFIRSFFRFLEHK